MQVETTNQQGVTERDAPDAPDTSSPTNELIDGVYELGQGGEPDPMTWLANGLIPEYHITILSGDGGMGKSYVALYLAQCVLEGKPFFGRPIERGNVLWIDAEGMGREENERRLFDTARGLGLEQPTKGFYFYAPVKGLSSTSVQTTIKKAITEGDVRLAILDSFSMGAAGSDMSSQQDTVALIRQIQQWGTTALLLDHITKAASKGNHAQATIFGSAFKRNGARSTLKLVKDGKDIRELIQDKSNFGPNTGGVRYEMKFETDGEDRKVVHFKHLGEAQPQKDKESKKSTKEKTFDVLQELSVDGGPVSVKDIAEMRGMGKKAIRNHLAMLSSDNRITANGDTTYSPIQES